MQVSKAKVKRGLFCAISPHLGASLWFQHLVRVGFMLDHGLSAQDLVVPKVKDSLVKERCVFYDLSRLDLKGVERLQEG